MNVQDASQELYLWAVNTSSVWSDVPGVAAVACPALQDASEAR